MMVKNTTVAAAMLFALCANVAYAAEEGSGEINFAGTIINAPCGISSNTDLQTVSMGMISNAYLMSKGESKAVDFNIKLEGCSIVSLKDVEVTLTGATDITNAKLLTLMGEDNKGAGISFMNARTNEAVELNKATKFSGLSDGDNTLKFTAKLVKTAADTAEIAVGDFKAQSHFVLAYK